MAQHGTIAMVVPTDRTNDSHPLTFGLTGVVLKNPFGASVFGAGSRALNNGQFGSTANADVTIGGLGRSFANDGENEGLA